MVSRQWLCAGVSIYPSCLINLVFVTAELYIAVQVPLQRPTVCLALTKFYMHSMVNHAIYQGWLSERLCWPLTTKTSVTSARRQIKPLIYWDAAGAVSGQDNTWVSTVHLVDIIIISIIDDFCILFILYCRFMFSWKTRKPVWIIIKFVIISSYSECYDMLHQYRWWSWASVLTVWSFKCGWTTADLFPGIGHITQNRCNASKRFNDTSPALAISSLARLWRQKTSTS